MSLLRYFAVPFSFCILTSPLLQARPESGQAGETKGAASAASSGSPAVSPPARPTMQKFSENLSLLLLNLNAFQSTPPPEQKNKVIGALRELKGLSHAFQPTMGIYAVDPIMKYISLDLPQQFGKIESAYTSGNYPQARYLLRQTTQLCVGCHSSSANKQSAVLQFSEPVNHLSHLEKAEYFAATRRHEEAMLAYEKALSDKQFKSSQPELWAKAVENLLAITIRIRNDAHITLEMCSSLLEEGGHNPDQKEMLQTWRASAKAWTQESLGQKLKGSETLTKAQALFEKGEVLGKKSSSFGYIEYLRAMSLLNELAMSPEPDALKAKAFALAGQTSERLKDIFLWLHPDAYYEACIRSNPRSPEAKACWKSWQIVAKQNESPTLDKEKWKQLQTLSQ